MCGRFALRTSVPEIARLLGIEGPVPAFTPRYNIAPTQKVPVCIAAANDERQLVPMRWGLIPHWASDARFGARTINARAETVAVKPAFRAAFRRRRCLVPADGYYEWRSAKPRKQPYFIHLRDDAAFCFAGLWETWEDTAEGRIDSFTVITTEANELSTPVHPRMPVILPTSAYDIWLDPTLHAREALEPLLQPYPSTAMALYPVSTRVHAPANDDPSCVEPLPGDPPDGP
jgi:putative SOS response-associated peptidase YedK